MKFPLSILHTPENGKILPLSEPEITTKKLSGKSYDQNEIRSEIFGLSIVRYFSDFHFASDLRWEILSMSSTFEFTIIVNS
jgi:hypothetical protein